MMANTSAFLLLRGLHFGGRGNAELALLLVGLCFAGVLVWVIERHGKPTT